MPGRDPAARGREPGEKRCCCRLFAGRRRVAAALESGRPWRGCRCRNRSGAPVYRCPERIARCVERPVRVKGRRPGRPPPPPAARRPTAAHPRPCSTSAKSRPCAAPLLYVIVYCRPGTTRHSCARSGRRREAGPITVRRRPAGCIAAPLMTLPMSMCRPNARLRDAL